MWRAMGELQILSSAQKDCYGWLNTHKSLYLLMRLAHQNSGTAIVARGCVHVKRISTMETANESFDRTIEPSRRVGVGGFPGCRSDRAKQLLPEGGFWRHELRFCHL